MRIKLDLDTETTERLIQAAVAENRPVGMHAEVMLRRALGLPFPRPLSAAATPTPPAKARTPQTASAPEGGAS